MTRARYTLTKIIRVRSCGRGHYHRGYYYMTKMVIRGRTTTTTTAQPRTLKQPKKAHVRQIVLVTLKGPSTMEVALVWANLFSSDGAPQLSVCTHRTVAAVLVYKSVEIRWVLSIPTVFVQHVTNAPMKGEGVTPDFQTGLSHSHEKDALHMPQWKLRSKIFTS